MESEKLGTCEVGSHDYSQHPHRVQSDCVNWREQPQGEATHATNCLKSQAYGTGCSCGAQTEGGEKPEPDTDIGLTTEQLGRIGQRISRMCEPSSPPATAGAAEEFYDTYCESPFDYADIGGCFHKIMEFCYKFAEAYAAERVREREKHHAKFAAEREQYYAQLRQERDALHHPFCNFPNQSIGGEGCICVVTYKQKLADGERAEKERDRQYEFNVEQIAKYASLEQDRDDRKTEAENYAHSLVKTREELANESYLCNQLREQVKELMPLAQARERAEKALASALEAKNAMQIDCQNAQHQADEFHEKWVRAKRALRWLMDACKSCLVTADVAVINAMQEGERALAVKSSEGAKG